MEEWKETMFYVETQQEKRPFNQSGTKRPIHRNGEKKNYRVLSNKVVEMKERE